MRLMSEGEEEAPVLSCNNSVDQQLAGRHMQPENVSTIPHPHPYQGGLRTQEENRKHAGCRVSPKLSIEVLVKSKCYFKKNRRKNDEIV